MIKKKFIPPTTFDISRNVNVDDFNVIDGDKRFVRFVEGTSIRVYAIGNDVCIIAWPLASPNYIGRGIDDCIASKWDCKLKGDKLDAWALRSLYRRRDKKAQTVNKYQAQVDFHKNLLEELERVIIEVEANKND